MQLICYRGGRAGYSIGDVVEVPDGTQQWDRVTFRVIVENDPLLTLPAATPSDSAALQAQLDAASSAEATDDDNTDKAEVNDEQLS